MRWRGRRQSDNVEDRRGMRGGRVAIGGGAAIIVVIVALLFGADPRQLLEQMQVEGPTVQTDPQARAPGSGYAPYDDTTPATPGEPGAPGAPLSEEDELAAFVSVVLAETEDVWRGQFQKMGRVYEEPRLVLFSDQVESACGMAGAAMGPFYCPGDRQVYIDLSFYEVLKQRLGAPGDFAQAYVVAHEVGHHVQHLLGFSDQVHALRSQLSEEEYNQLSVRLELQADFLAGLWAHHAERTAHILEPGDIEEALNAASAIGDDRLQMQSRGRVVPDAFTHGTSAQRVRWFRRGYESGDITQGDTFGAETL